MEDHAAAILAQLIRIADALECIAEAQGHAVEPRRSIEQAFIAAYEIDSARNAREGLAERNGQNKRKVVWNNG